MAMFTQISILSSAPYGNTEKDEKVKGYRYNICDIFGDLEPFGIGTD